MDTKISFKYLSEQDMIEAGVMNMDECVEVMEDMLLTLNRGDYVMGGQNHNSHGCMVTFPDDPQFPGMPKNGDDRRFMAMPAYLGGKYQMAGMKWYGSNVENKKKGLPRSILMMMLNDKDTGAPLALMSANLLSCYRTGGIPGVGAKYLARKDAKTVAAIGPGVMGKTSLAAFMSVRPGIDTVKVKGRGQRSLNSFVDFVKENYPQIKNIVICDTIEEAVRDADIISMTTSVGNKEAEFPYIDESWIKKGALISMPSAARFEEDFLVNRCKKVVDNWKLYEAWEEEYPYPTYDQLQIIGTKFTDLKHLGKITRDEIIDITDIITGKAEGRKNDDEIIIYSVGGMPVEDIAWGATVYRNALKKNIGVTLPLWDAPTMA
ncbi:tyramine oxidase subunit B [Butyricicoccus porcorum]|uniref:tyramine oxidase subunit B n=1 Tax=Butyricicoccus porcorum TaxID=1945634 RepID=UPI002984F2A6|nr:tyramine oxidase subunit B [Butyricicoccus porcorum]MDY4483925.1 tyramine oxidase subunit B [Butyricicoccus porcorum]